MIHAVSIWDVRGSYSKHHRTTMTPTLYQPQITIARVLIYCRSQRPPTFSRLASHRKIYSWMRMTSQPENTIDLLRLNCECEKHEKLRCSHLLGVTWTSIVHKYEQRGKRKARECLFQWLSIKIRTILSAHENVAVWGKIICQAKPWIIESWDSKNMDQLRMLVRCTSRLTSNSFHVALSCMKLDHLAWVFSWWYWRAGKLNHINAWKE